MDCLPSLRPQTFKFFATPAAMPFVALIHMMAMFPRDCIAERAAESDPQRTTSMCRTVGFAVTREDPYGQTSCKCPKKGDKVWCVDNGHLASAERKFDAKDVFETCSSGGAYCAQRAWDWQRFLMGATMTMPGIKIVNSHIVYHGVVRDDHTCAAVGFAVPRQKAPLECKCPKDNDKVWCVENDVMASSDRRFEVLDIFLTCNGGGAYCALAPWDWRRFMRIFKMGMPGKEIETGTKMGMPGNDIETHTNMGQAVEPTQPTHIEQLHDQTLDVIQPRDVSAADGQVAMNTTTTTTTPGLDLMMWVNANSFCQGDKRDKSNFKCCEHSGGTEAPRIQNMQEKLPFYGSYACINFEGCGCMFGPQWHDMSHWKVPGTCRVRLGYLALKLNVPPETLVDLFNQS